MLYWKKKGYPETCDEASNPTMGLFRSGKTSNSTLGNQMMLEVEQDTSSRRTCSLIRNCRLQTIFTPAVSDDFQGPDDISRIRLSFIKTHDY